MASFSKILHDIESVKIQGAEVIAKAAVKALNSRIKKKRISKKKDFFSEVSSASRDLIKTRPTEPLMRNSLLYIKQGIDSRKYSALPEIRKEFYDSVKFVLGHFEEAEKMIAEIGSRIVEEGSVVYTHCHSSSVVNVIRKAKESGKWFRVYNTETRPLFQGRKTAKEIASMKIPVNHYVDSAARLAIKEADIVLFGADAMTSEGRIVNKIGSEMFSIMANKYDVPVYICMDSWKFNPKSILGYEEKIEGRGSKEIWSRAPKGVKIQNPAFERVLPDLITAIVSELGVYPPEIFVEEVRKAYPWMF